jgi:putative transposase
VTRALDALALVDGAPQAIRVDNGPEFLAQAFVEWCAGQGTAILTSNRASPSRTPTSNRTYGTEVLNAHLVAVLG